MDIQRYYASIREKREDLAKQNPSGFCLVVSVFNLEKNSTAGNPCEVSVQDAARLVTDGTHRVATGEEYKTFTGQQDAERERIAQEQVNRTRNQFSQALGVSLQGLAPQPPVLPPAKSGK